LKKRAVVKDESMRKRKRRKAHLFCPGGRRKKPAMEGRRAKSRKKGKYGTQIRIEQDVATEKERRREVGGEIYL